MKELAGVVAGEDGSDPGNEQQPALYLVVKR